MINFNEFTSNLNHITFHTENCRLRVYMPIAYPTGPTGSTTIVSV